MPMNGIVEGLTSSSIGEVGKTRCATLSVVTLAWHRAESDPVQEFLPGRARSFTTITRLKSNCGCR